jgi:hypothetical protein
MTAFRKERLQGLSCLKGNFHEQFLGGWAGAIPPGYPADEETYPQATRLVPTQPRFQPRLMPGVRVRPLTAQGIVLEENHTWTTV